MPIIKLETVVSAPVERVFDLARSIDLHKDTMSKYDEKAIAGVTKGLIKMNETVTWEATHFGVRQSLTSKITAFDRPRYFRDSMVAGAFKRFDHDHFFERIGAETFIKDVFDYDSPLGILGRIADALFVEKHLLKCWRKEIRLSNPLPKATSGGSSYNLEGAGALSPQSISSKSFSSGGIGT